ncbi:MAG: L-lactate permease [Nanoarchaeota archaeon]|nr:L-lactate permease [Nanoarchaeota archaeon]
MLLLYSLLPILLIIILMGFLSWSAKKTMPLAAILSIILAIFIWKMNPNWILASSIKGALTAFNIMLIIFGALCLMYIIKTTKLMNTIIEDFKILTPDSRLQTIIIAWLFVAFLEGIAGFGTPAAITAPLLLILGFPALAAVSLPLIFDTIPVTFGAVGVPITIGLKTSVPALTLESLKQIGIYSAAFHSIIALFFPLLILSLMTRFFAKEKSFLLGLKAWKLSLISSIAFIIPYFLSAYFLGPELPSILGSLTSLVICITLIHKRICLPKKLWSFNSSARYTNKKINVKKSIKAWLPYISASLILIITRLPFISSLIKKVSINYFNILNTSLSYNLEILYSPGIIFLIIAILTSYMLKLKLKTTLANFKQVFYKIIPASIALIFTIILVQIMINTNNNLTNYESMLLIPAKTLANYLGTSFLFFSPFVGALGAFLAGSNTVSNLLFGFFQYNMAENLGLNIILVLSLQAVGGAIGNMICIHNIVAACTTVNYLGNEGKVFRANLLPFFIYTTLVGILGLLAYLIL